jgi:putative SOS response-associated peptidase YedK
VHIASVGNKPVYRSSFLQAQFCWLSVSYFLGSVWKEGREHLVRVEREDQQAFLLAGIWSEWVLESGSNLLSFCLLMRDSDIQLKAQKLRVGNHASQCYAVLSPEALSGWVDLPPKDAIETLSQLAFPKLRVLPFVQPH